MTVAFNPERPAVDISLLRWALVIVLAGLIFMTSRHIVGMLDHRAALMKKNRRDAEWLHEAGEQAKFLETLKTALHKQAVSDPVAARIESDFFPAQRAPLLEIVPRKTEPPAAPSPLK